MQISNQQPLNATQQPSNGSAPLASQVVQASIVQRTSDKEALVTINGQPYQAVFEDGVPSNKSLMVQVRSVDDMQIHLKQIPSASDTTGASTPSKMQTADELLKKAGVPITAELRAAVQRVTSENIPASADTIKGIQKILQSGEGTLSQKLDTLSQMAKRQLPFTPKTYEALFRIQYGPALSNILDQLAKEMPDFLSSGSIQELNGKNPPEATSGVVNELVGLLRNIRQSGQVSPDQWKNIREQIGRLIQEGGANAKLVQNVTQLMDKLNRDIRMSKSYEAVGRTGEAQRMVQRTADALLQLIQIPSASTSSLGSSKNEKSVYIRPMAQTLAMLSGFTSSMREQIAKELPTSESSSLKGVSQSQAWQQSLSSFIETIRQTIQSQPLSTELSNKIKPQLSAIEGMLTDKKTSAQQTLSQSSEKDVLVLHSLDQITQLLNGEVQRISALSAVDAASMVRVTNYIPAHLQQVAQDFTQTKQELLKNVDRMSQFLEQKIPQASSYIQRIIEPTIEMVDRLVTKGEFAMFADMGFEHDVLRISGELQQVKGLLEKGKQDEALQSFQRIRADLEKLNWQPSYTKVERVFSKMTGDGTMQNPFEVSRDWQQQTLSARGVQEWIRGMGLNHEQDALNYLAQRERRDAGNMNYSQIANGKDTGNGTADDGRPQQNFKSMLLDGINGAASGRARELMDQALSNITGQQLLSKQEHGNPIQSLYVQIPLPWEDGTKPVQVQVQSRTHGAQMDWKNSSLYFLLDTPKYGTTGIGITVVNREMAVRVQNDNPEVKKAFEPYIPGLKKELEGIGYKINGVTFGPITSDDKKQSLRDTVPTVDVKDARARAIQQLPQEGVDFSV